MGIITVDVVNKKPAGTSDFIYCFWRELKHRQLFYNFTLTLYLTCMRQCIWVCVRVCPVPRGEYKTRLMNCSALLMLWASYETNSLQPRRHPHVRWGTQRTCGSRNGANKRRGEGAKRAKVPTTTWLRHEKAFQEEGGVNNTAEFNLQFWNLWCNAPVNLGSLSGCNYYQTCLRGTT